MGSQIKEPKKCAFVPEARVASWSTRCKGILHRGSTNSRWQLGWRRPGHETPYKWEFQENGKWFEVAVEGAVITNLKDFGVQAAIDGLGIAFTTELMVAPHVAGGDW
jgi:hypothetical protein